MTEDLAEVLERKPFCPTCHRLMEATTWQYSGNGSSEPTAWQCPECGNVPNLALTAL